jgi:hypothetical protein
MEYRCQYRQNIGEFNIGISVNFHIGASLIIISDIKTTQCGKFVSRGGYLRPAILMLSIYLLLNFRNLRRTISKLSSQGNYQRLVV